VFFILRHGQTDWNKAQKLQGSTDIPLNDQGRAQAVRAAELLQGHNIGRIIASPLSRALETAQIVGHALSLSPVIDDRLIERGFGTFEGLNFAEVDAHRAQMGPVMNPEPDLDGKHYPKDAERLEAVIKRIDAAFDEHMASGEICLFVFHGIPFRTVTRRFLGEMHTSPNAAPVKFYQDHGVWHMDALDPHNLPITSKAYEVRSTMGSL